MLEDKLLIWRLRRGDSEALGRIYEKYRDALLRIAGSLLNEANAAEDVVQDVFTMFVRAAGSFELTGSLKGYLITCTANKARNVNRTKMRQGNANIEEIEPIVSTFKRPEQWVIYDEENERLNKAMAELAYEQKEAVILRIQGEMKFRDIASLQNTTVKTAISRYRYGLNKLRSILDGEVKK